jgi:hypothetical protein
MIHQRPERWQSATDPARSLTDELTRIRTRCGTRTTLDRLWLGLYGGLGYQGIDPVSEETDPNDDDSMGVENVIRMLADTVISKVLRDDLQPRAITSGGDWRQRTKARNLDQWLQAQLRTLEINEEVLPRVLQHALVTGTGCAYAWHDGERLIAEAQPPWELHVDPAEGARGKVRTLYRERQITRAEAEDLYPGEDFPASQQTWGDAGQVIDLDDLGADTVTISEGWSLPTRSGPGRHVAICGESVLADEEWAEERFPFVFLRYKRRPVGFWGQGLVEDLSGAQVTMAAAQVARLDAIARGSAPFVLAARGSNLVMAQVLSATNMRVIEHSGVEPKVITPNAISPGLTEVVGQMRGQMFAIAGVSEGSATMQKPSGLDSGKALRTYHDLESERLSQLSKSVETWIVAVGGLLICAARSLALTTDVADVTAIGKGSTRRISWADVDVPEDEYVLSIVPASALSTSLSGRIQDAQDMLSSGMITDPIEARKLLRLPDLEHSDQLAMAHVTLLESIIEEDILESGTAWTPEATWPLALAQDLASRYLMWAKANRYPAERIALLEAFLSEVIALQQPPPSPPPQLPAMAGESVPNGLPSDIGSDIGSSIGSSIGSDPSAAPSAAPSAGPSAAIGGVPSVPGAIAGGGVTALGS